MMKIHFPFGTLRRSHLDAGLLSAYLDAQATPDERRRVETHLAECAACRRELAELRQTVTLLQTLPRLPVPRAFTLAEVQVGLGRSAGQAAWLGGMLRGLAAVSAVAVVAVLTATLLRRGEWQSPAELARIVAPAATATDVHVQDAAPAPFREATPAVAPAPTHAVEAGAAPTKAPAAAMPTRRSAPTAAPAAQAAMPTAEPAPAAAAPTRSAEPAPALAAVPPTDAPAAPPAPARSAPSPATPGGAAAASTASATGPAVNAKDTARPGEGGAFADAGRDPSVFSALPPTFTLAFAAGGNLWAIERAGARPLAQADGLAAPTISPDHAWIAYRRPGADGAEVWAMPWAGGEPQRLLTERDLQAEGLAGYRPARIVDVRWLPTGRTLAVAAVAEALVPGGTLRMEWWRVEVESAARRLAAHSDLPDPPVAAPDGAAFAFLRRATDNPAAADVWLVAAHGANERAVLRVPSPAGERNARAQIHWLPDSRSFWLAVEDARSADLLLYRVPLEGAAATPVRLNARQAFWSADGNRLAYVGPADAATGAQELFVAAADGAAARRYATLLSGRFVAWSPDSTHFLYEDGGHLFVGAAQEAPSRLASNVGEARWVGADQVVYIAPQGGARQLIYHALGGQPIVLQTLPPDMSLDGLWP